MKTKSSLLVLFLLIAGSIIAQDFKTRSLEAMGYRNESIMGINGAISYFLKVQPRDDVDRTNLILQVKPSKVASHAAHALALFSPVPPAPSAQYLCRQP